MSSATHVTERTSADDFTAGMQPHSDGHDTRTDAPEFRLARSMAEFETVRTASLKEEGIKQLQYPLSNSGFFRTLVMFEGRALGEFVLSCTEGISSSDLFTVSERAL